MIFFLVCTIYHIGFFLWLYKYWKGAREIAPADGYEAFISVIIPVRNEAGNVAFLLEDLIDQTYSNKSYEVVVVDDGSEDGTAQIATDILKASPLKYKVVGLQETGFSGKKEAITKGVEQAAGDIIVTTDGDCRVPENWLKIYAMHYHQTDAVMLTGPVRMTGNMFFQQLQRYEFAGLIGLGAASLTSGNPGMCNGANLSYRKEAFQEVNGYEGNKHIPSGDDEFLLQKIFSRYPKRVAFVKNSQAVVETNAKETLTELVNQRIRWASKWKFHQSFFIRLMAIFIFLDYGSFLYAGVSVVIWPEGLKWFVAGTVLRWLTTYNFVAKVLRFSEQPRFVFISLCAEIFYPFFVTFLGIASIFGKYSWKGRQYK